MVRKILVTASGNFLPESLGRGGGVKIAAPPPTLYVELEFIPRLLLSLHY